MYYCNECDNTFEEPKTFFEKLGDLPTDGETQSVCPHCNGYDYEEAELCNVCDEYKPKSRVDDDICEECSDKAIERFYDFWNSLEDYEKEIIKDNIDELLYED